MSSTAPTYSELQTDARREALALSFPPDSLQRIEEWVADADLEIGLLWQDWNFLHANASFSTIASTATYTLSSLSLDTTLANWDRDSFVWEPTADTWQTLEEMDYYEWRESVRLGTVDTGDPTNVVVKPNKDLVLWPTPDAVKTVTADYWTWPVRMSGDSDESAIPGQFRRIIVLRAMLNIIASGYEMPRSASVVRREVRYQAQYDELLQRLEAQELPDQRGRRRARGDQDIRVVPV